MFVTQIENGLDLQDVAERIAAIYDTYLAPGQGIEPHNHTGFEEVYYVLSGYGMMTIGSEQMEIYRGDVVHIPEMALHTLLNTAQVPLRFVTVTVRVTQDKTSGELSYFA
ncbi:MAG TPA: cupin domain-containing protein [Candidatus Methanoperedenaceae archaeon]|nr:cupin domain-containing protein [Candidatus Methanoperedenaceae archaeon]